VRPHDTAVARALVTLLIWDTDVSMARGLPVDADLTKKLCLLPRLKRGLRLINCVSLRSQRELQDDQRHPCRCEHEKPFADLNQNIKFVTHISTPWKRSSAADRSCVN
jgi:hypothetical protein